MNLRAFQLATLCAVFFLQAPVSAQQPWELQVAAAEVAYLEGDYEVAQAKLRVAVAQLEQANNQQELATQMQNLAFLIYLQGKFPEAEATYQRALTESEAAWGADSLEYAENLMGTIRIMRRQNRFAEAEPLIQKAVEIRRKRLGNDHKITGHSVLDLAVNYERQGKFIEADAAYAEAIMCREKEFGKNSKLLIPYLEQYAKAMKRSTAKLDARIADLTANGSTESPPPDPPDAPSDRPRFLKSPQGSGSSPLLPTSGPLLNSTEGTSDLLGKRIVRPN